MVKMKHSFDPSFFREEERYGFYIEKWRKEVWAVELDLLYELDRVCRELGIQYFLSNGALIGAVRDGHFIPWDDDIDVMMLREDYDILVRKGADHLEEPYFLQTGYSEFNYNRGHSQLRNSNTCGALPQSIDRVSYNQGIFIDIFVLDAIDESCIEEQMARTKRCALNISRMNRQTEGFSFRSIIQRIRKKYLKSKYNNSVEIYKEMEDIYRNNDSEYVEIMLFRWDLDKVRRYRKEWFSTVQYVRFEDGIFPAPGNYDRVLATRYGEDYMVPKRIANSHNENGDIIFDVNRSYKEVIEERKASRQNLK